VAGMVSPGDTSKSMQPASHKMRSANATGPGSALA
jgi:hypothetical protein